MRLHVCTHYSLTLQGATMFLWKFIAYIYQSPMTYIFLTDFQEASFVCCLLTSHSIPAPPLDWRHICKQVSPKLIYFLSGSDMIVKNGVRRGFTKWIIQNRPCLSDGGAGPSNSKCEVQDSSASSNVDNLWKFCRALLWAVQHYRLNFHTVFKEPEMISRLKEIGRNVNVVLCGKTRRMKGA